MIKWSKVFETKIKLVDQQHEKLFSMLNRTAEKLKFGEVNAADINTLVDDLLEYSAKHFKDEEQIMAKFKLDKSFVTQHKMEHHSFIYDITRMKDSMSVDEQPMERAQELISFISSWLVLHTLRRDPVMANQIEAIVNGATPEEAYQKAKTMTPAADASKMMIDALIHLWGDASKRVKQLEEELNRLAQ